MKEFDSPFGVRRLVPLQRSTLGLRGGRAVIEQRRRDFRA